MSRKSALLVTFLLCTLLNSFAYQNNDIPENTQITGTRDSIDYYLAKSEHLSDSLPELSLQYASRALQLSTNTNYNEGVAYASRLLGEINIYLEDYYKAEKHLRKAQVFYNNTKKELIRADINFLLGQTNFHLGKYSDAKEQLEIASEIYNSTNESQKYANTLQRIGLVYDKANQLNKAEEYFYKSLALNKTLNNNANIAELYQNLGIVCYKSHNDSLAKNYFDMAIMFYKKEHDLNGIGINYSNIGLIYLRNKSFNTALKNFRTANTYFTKSDYLTGQMWALNNIGASQASMGQLNAAKHNFDKSLAIAEKTGSVEGRLTNLQDLAKWKEQTGDLKASLQLQKTYTTLLDSSLKAQAEAQIANLESLYLQENKALQHTIENTANNQSYFKFYWLAIIALISIAAISIAYFHKRKDEKKSIDYRTELENLVEERTNELKIQINERRTAEESDKLKSAFLANMSHELRTPMNAIIAFSTFLREPELDEIQKHEYLDHINSAGDTLLSLIDDIIDIAKIESQQLKIFIQPTNINQLLGEIYKVYNELKTTNNKQQIQFEFNSDFQYNYIINTDSKRLKQVISNLLENAFKYTEKGKIELGFSTTDNTVLFYVSDTGIGIPKDKQEVIFDRFSQLRNINDTRTTHGTGLGLAISKNLSKLLGGSIYVDSEPGKGSTFYVRIPVESIKKQINTNNRNKSLSPTHISSKYDWNDLTILVAEDEDLNYKVLDACLKKTKAHIIRARDGASAVEICQSQKVDIVLMDIQMPGMDGYQATQKIKRFNNRTPVIAQTSFAMIGEKERCLNAGCDDFITKPLNIETLLKKIESHLFCYAKQKNL